MSRIGILPVVAPAGVTTEIQGRTVRVKGPKGELSFTVPREVKLKPEGDQLILSPANDSGEARALWGTARALLNNLVIGVSAGFEKKLEIRGVGYRAAKQGNDLKLNLGFSHDVVYRAPEGIELSTPVATQIVIKGIDKQRVGQVAAEIRRIRPPEPYKGKGVRYAGEFVPLKAGKKK